MSTTTRDRAARHRPSLLADVRALAASRTRGRHVAPPAFEVTVARDLAGVDYSLARLLVAGPLLDNAVIEGARRGGAA
ncbi:hypothetical protein ACTHAM_002387 [Cellulomonas soli]|uniref:hypothetical protein n=1 Tax=Cellulomonas soli TaxID=931535 RepID=UPI003F8597B0